MPDAAASLADGGTDAGGAAVPDSSASRERDSQGNDVRDGAGPDRRSADTGSDVARNPDVVIDPAQPKTFSVCTGLPELIRPGITDDWDSYWWDGDMLKVMVHEVLHQARTFEEMHNKAPLGGLVLTKNYAGQGDVYTLGIGKGTFDVRSSIPVQWWGTSVSKDPENSNAYMIYHIEYDNACPGFSSFHSGSGLAVSTDGGFSWDDRGVIVGDLVPVDCADRGSDYFIRGGIAIPHAIDEGDRSYVSFYNESGGTPTDPANQGVIWARISLADIRRTDAAQRFRFYNGSGAGGSWNISTQTGQICGSSDPATCSGNNVFSTSVHSVPIPGGQTSWRQTGKFPAASAPAGVQRITWNENTGTYTMLLKDLLGSFFDDWNGNPELLYHAGRSLAEDPLNWKAFEIYAGADGKTVTTRAGERSHLVFPNSGGVLRGGAFHNTLVSPFDGTEKKVSAGHDMRLFFNDGQGVGQPTSTIGVKFGTGATPPSCSAGFR